MISEGMEKERMTGELEMEWNDNRIGLTVDGSNGKGINGEGRNGKGVDDDRRNGK